MMGIGRTMNLRKLFIAVLCGLGCTAALPAEIVKLDRLQSLEEVAAPLDEDTLLILDVDYTLIVGCDAIWHLKGREVRYKVRTEIFENPALLLFDLYPEGYLHSRMIKALETHSMLVDPASPQLIRDLQKRGVPVIAFTASVGGPLGEIKSLADLRCGQLKAFGFSFETTFPDLGSIEFSKHPGKEFPPLFHQGVLFASNHTKGEVLPHLLSQLSWHPHRVVMVDDRLEQLQSIEKALEGTGIEFVGLHYRAAEELPYHVDEELGRFQFHHLAETGEWLHDDEARAYLAEQAAL